SVLSMYTSRRSALTCLNGCVSSSQTLASQIGVDILKKGGNAADAAVSVAAALNLMEPHSTGIGGDMFCLYYNKSTNKVYAINGSGRAPANLTLEHLNKLGYNEHNKFEARSPLSITVPGACAGWVDCVEKFGSGNLSMQEILDPVISVAKGGFPVAGPITAHGWGENCGPLMDPRNEFGKELLVQDSTGQLRAPYMGEVFRNPGLADVLESVAKHGKDGFYKGWVADAIVAAIESMGGVLSHEDLAHHTSTFEEPISIDYKGFRLWEIPPNGQGIVALEALNILKNFNVGKLGHNSTDYLHVLIEAVRLSFADALQYCADPSFSKVPFNNLLNGHYGKLRAKLIDMGKSNETCLPGDIESFKSDTVYFSTADKDGNFCSFINSTYMGFGSGVVPQNCGFTLQNRGFNFSLVPGHPNVVEPRKRSYHTIIPAMVTDAKTGELLLSYGVMGGFMQPQGHVQVLLNMIEFGMDPQEALDAPRFLVGSGHRSALGSISLESGIKENTIAELKQRGHDVTGPVEGFKRSIFGRGQVIARSDPRADGTAVGY
uniref:Gamma-glutamyltransferase n=1 Tax=Ciona savignyi TaxID=51511 RepID=H2Z5T6_CIOSA